MSVSLTELRQRLFELADRVIETGEPLSIERRGVRLQLIRAAPAAARTGRLARLKSQSLVIGAPLRPDESPAQWSAGDELMRVAEVAADYAGVAPRRRKPRKG